MWQGDSGFKNSKSMNGTDKTDSWICTKCGSVIIYEVKKDKAHLTTVNKQKPTVRFLTAEVRCKNCGNVERIISKDVLRIYNAGFNEGRKNAHKVISKNPEYLKEDFSDVNWSRNRDIEKRILALLDTDELSEYDRDEIEKRLKSPLYKDAKRPPKIRKY